MPAMKEWAESLVQYESDTPGGGWCVFLASVGEEQSVYIGPYDTPALAREMAEQMQSYLAAVVREAVAQRPAKFSVVVRPVSTP